MIVVFSRCFFFQRTIRQWRIFFCIIAVLYVACALFFLIFAKGEEQWWAKSSPSSSTVPSFLNHEVKVDAETTGKDKNHVDGNI